jgi:hypothetical protein
MGWFGCAVRCSAARPFRPQVGALCAGYRARRGGSAWPAASPIGIFIIPTIHDVFQTLREAVKAGFRGG